MTKKQIDFMTSARNCEVITKVDIDNNHRMVRAKGEINKKLMRLKTIRTRTMQIRP